MGQFGMSMPGQVVQRRPSVNVYTGLLALAVVCLIGASAFVAFQLRKITPDGNLMSMQADTVANPSAEIKFPR